ncbi:MAG: ABC transporter permease [Bacillota bacterium]
MLTSRWRKLIGDLSINKMRTVFAIVAICIGVFGISVVANSYSILLREMDKNYMNTNPASATLWTEPLSDSYIQKIIALPYIKDAEKREKVIGRVQVGSNEWKDIWLFVINDFNNVRLDTFTTEKGKMVPDTGEILLERKALSIAKADIGQSLNIKIPDGKITALELTGTVHAPGLAPAWMEGFAYGFITPGTLKLLGGASKNTELKIIVAEDAMNKKHIRDDAYLLKEYLEKDGFRVTRIDIPRPGKHPHYDQMATLLFLMEIFGFLALILSGVLVANMITAILEQQTRQIGIMKTIGASSLQIAGLYQGMVLALAFTAMLVSIPAGILAGRGYAWIAAEILNFNIYSYSIPIYVFILEFTVGLLVPTLTSFYPIVKGSRVTVREAITDYGISQEKYGGNTTDIVPQILSFLPRPFLLSIRNTFRRKGRLIFTLLVMAAGGTGFIVAMNIYASMYNTVDEKINSISYDIQVTFDHPQPLKNIEDSINEIPGVAKVEAWGGTSASRIYDDRTSGNSFSIVAPPSSTGLMSAPPLYSGRWLEPDDKNVLVINQRLLSNEPDIRVGDEIVLRINQSDTKWKVVGISKEMIGMPAAYADSEYLAKITQKEGFARNAVIVTDISSSSSQSDIAKLLEQNMADRGMHVSSLIKMADYRKAIEDHLLIIATFLIIMSVLVIIVGGLGLATTISVNVLERTREIGIMRAIGASTHSLTGVIVTEGIIIGVLSWFISMALSWPLSRFVSYNFGMIFFEAPLEFAASISGFVIWLVIVILFAAMASFYPSRKASQMPVRDALSYE